MPISLLETADPVGAAAAVLDAPVLDAPVLDAAGAGAVEVLADDGDDVDEADEQPAAASRPTARRTATRMRGRRELRLLSLAVTFQPHRVRRLACADRSPGK
jgi:hypothetical protein